MENPEVKIEVTALPPESTPPAPPELPELVIVENTTVVEQTPEGNTKWQGEIETILRLATENQQNQTAQVIQTIQGFRETLDRILNCILGVELKLSALNPPQPEKQPETSAEAVPIVPPETIPAVEKKEKENPPSTQKKRQRI